MSKPRPTTKRIHCNNCGPNRLHDLIAKRSHGSEETVPEGFQISWNTTYELLECRACQEVTLRREYTFSEWDGASEVAFYPPRIARHQPGWIEKLPINIVGLIKEVYAALHADSRQLAMMGARTIIDMIMTKKIGDLGDFKKKREAMVKAGLITAAQSEILATAIDVGSAAAHRGHTAKPEHINSVMDIVEHLLQSTILEDVAAELKKATPPRPR